ncbi:MAG: hypothetical protein N2489_02375 [Clostridia bacterium]|nr:hypothetical protein [Clostridia bacterium]
MQDLRNAYEILGVKEGADKDEIIKRYDILLKKIRISKANGEDPGINIDEINKAYNTLMGYSTGEPEERELPPSNTLSGYLFKMMGIDEYKARNFLYYYKFHIIAVLASVLLAGYFVYSIVNRVEPELSIVVAGDLYIQDTEDLRQKFKAELPELNEISLDHIILSEKLDGQQAYAMQMKLVTLMAAGDIDVFILDRENFNKYAKSGAFMSLDSMVNELGIDKNDNKDFILKAGENEEEHLYGFDASNSKLLQDIKSIDEKKIAALKVNSKHMNNALKFLKLLQK